ncbi:MAG: hypothetical protein H6712_19685 [Myxococcales bacterium]|nr:hypothetical protein [Myxococcales bacterium]MCB9716099.1 hypothetical protein [Myxococcales bacterium]
MNRADAAIPDGVTIDVRVDEGILEASELRDWVDEAARSALEALPDQAKRRGTVRIMVDGALYDYRVTLEARQGDRLEGDPRQWDCKCSNGELLDRLQDELPPMLQRLVYEEQEEPRPPAPTHETEPNDDGAETTPVHKERLGPRGAAGVTLTALGTTGIAAGLAMAIVANAPPDALWSTREKSNALPAGLVLGASTGVLLTGVVLLALRERVGHRDPSATALLPTLDGRGSLALTLRKRF